MPYLILSLKKNEHLFLPHYLDVFQKLWDDKKMNIYFCPTTMAQTRKQHFKTTHEKRLSKVGEGKTFSVGGLYLIKAKVRHQ